MKHKEVDFLNPNLTLMSSLSLQGPFYIWMFSLVSPNQTSSKDERDVGLEDFQRIEHKQFLQNLKVGYPPSHELKGVLPHLFERVTRWQPTLELIQKSRTLNTVSMPLEVFRLSNKGKFYFSLPWPLTLNHLMYTLKEVKYYSTFLISTKKSHEIKYFCTYTKIWILPYIWYIERK